MWVDLFSPVYDLYEAHIIKRIFHFWEKARVRFHAVKISQLIAVSSRPRLGLAKSL